MTVTAAFNGTTSRINCASGNDFTSTAFTLACMVYNTSATSQRTIVSFASGGGATSNPRLVFDSTTNIAMEFADGNFPPWTGTVTSGSWYLVVITKAAGTNVPKLYLTSDGSTWTKDGVAADAGTGPDPSSTIDDIWIGHHNGASFWNGEIAAIAYANTEASSSTVHSLTTFSNWSTLTNLRFFTGETLINAGTVDDTGSGNNDETSRTAVSTGSQTVPSWLVGFGGGPVPPTPITMQQVGTRSAGGTTSLTIAYPVTGLAAGDLFLVGRTVKPSTATVTTPPSPFTALANTTGGTGSQGIDTGPQRLSTEYLISPTGSETGNLTTAQGGSPDSANGCMIRFRKPPGTYWAVPEVTTADDNSHGTARSAAGSAIDVQPGDMLCAYFGSDTDTTTAFTSATFTGTGLTTGTVTIDLGAGGVATGQDSGLYITHALVTAATGSTAITATLAGGPSSCGPIHIIRLRAIYPIHYGRETLRPSRIVPVLARRRR